MSESESELLLDSSRDHRTGTMQNFRRNRRKRFRRLGAILRLSYRCWWWLYGKCFSQRELCARTIRIGQPYEEPCVMNEIRNQKYSLLSFLPCVLFQQFKFFLNLYFLIMAFSQFIPDIRVSYLYTYWGPLGFVLTVTICREAVDDFRRYQRDREVNSQKYKIVIGPDRPLEMVSSSKIKVGDIIIVDKDERVPADLVLLRTTEKTGTVFVRTDQLDGETDWKLRLAVPATQRLSNDSDLFRIRASIYAEKPQKDIHSFIGTFSKENGTEDESIGLENTLWANTVVASGRATGVVVYTGGETRSVMNNSTPRSKVGLIDMEINNLTKLLFCAVIGLATVMMCLKGFNGPWYRYMFRFVLLFSYIIPISLRVNLDMGKAYYSYKIQKDSQIQGTVVRSTTIPEELGRISYLLSDKTGTLTKNEMVFKKIHMGTTYYNHDLFDEVAAVIQSLNTGDKLHLADPFNRNIEALKLWESVKAIAICHNVTPINDSSKASSDNKSNSPSRAINIESNHDVSYQAASPDEIALVKWAEDVGLTLVARDLDSVTLHMNNGSFNSGDMGEYDDAGSIATAETMLSEEDINGSTSSINSTSNRVFRYQILQMFPFTSEIKRMGIIVKDLNTKEITFYLKGADIVMNNIVQTNDWMMRECANMANEGLRTLVVAKKILSAEEYIEFDTQYTAARLCVTDRGARVAAVIESLESNMELLCITGVEDCLQDRVRSTLDLLRKAGVKIWMLTGDKLETAHCIAKSSHLVDNNQQIYVIRNVQSRTDAHLELNNFRRLQNCALIVSGESLNICLQYYHREFLELATACPAVVCCRCSPTQKAQVVSLIQQQTGKRTCAIGDGGNDVSMIQQADVGIGIEGREGQQASLAGDISITQFSYLAKLLLVHGRRSYKRSAALSQFVIHRGLIISTMQAVFSAVFYVSSVALYQGFLMVGYATIYTMFPVFSLVLDEDISTYMALAYPELYKGLSKGRSLSYKTFFIWVLISIYQGGVIMYGALVLFEDEFIHIVSISFTALILTELIMVALTIRTWHRLMVLAELFSLSLYLLSLVILHDFFDWDFIWSYEFLLKVFVITLVSCLPLYVIKFLKTKFSPPPYSKLS